MFKLHPLFLSLIAAQGILIPVSQTSAATLKPFSPYLNDNKAGVFCVCNGSTQTLSGVQRFASGLSGTQSFTLGELQNLGGSTDYSLVGKPRLDPGNKDYPISIPAANGDTDTFEVYNSANMIDLPPVGLDTQVPNYIDVKGGQYINARVAQVSKGTINVDIGAKGATTTAETNGWSMAAKQSRLFAATGSGNMNWNSDNRITFTSILQPDGEPYLTLPADSVATYKGEFSVTTRDNETTRFNVTRFSDFQNYNNWLINQLSIGRLSPDSYSSELDKAVSITSGEIVYRRVAQDPGDEAAQDIGELVVLSADGAKATATVNKTLEVINGSSAVLAANGGSAVINGKVSSISTGTPGGSALTLQSGATGINNGVINGSFLNLADGTGVDSATVNSSVFSYTVLMGDNSRFRNKGVINTAGNGTALGVFAGSAINNGNINVGVANWSTADGIFVNGKEASFANAAGGTLYLGRALQNSLTDEAADVRLNDSLGIRVGGDGSAINDGHIVIGSLTQGSTAMRVDAGPNARLQNNGIIDVNGHADFRPDENIAMSVNDSGSGGLVGNAGTINLNGDNSTAIKVLATSGNRASAYSDGTINVNGSADPLNGTYNTAVWVKGEEDGSAYANITGPINLGGKGAVGIRAEGNATVDTESLFNIRGGEYQTGYLVIGPEAKINLPVNGRYGAYDTAWYSTIFNYQNGAKFDGAGMTITPDASFSTGIAGSGSGTGINTRGAIFNVGRYSTGINLSGGAQGTLDEATRLNLTSFNATGAAVDGDSTRLTNHADISGFFNGEVGLTAQNKGQITNTGNISLQGEEASGIRALSSASVDNSGTIDVSNGSTALYAEGFWFPGDDSSTTITNSGTLNVTAGNAPDFASTHGAIARGELARVNQNGIVNLYGTNSIAGQVLDGGTIVTGGSVVFHDPRQRGYVAGDWEARLVSNGGSTDVSTANSTLYWLNDHAWLQQINPAEVTLSGENSVGIAAFNGAYVEGTDRFIVNGEGATAIRLQNGASAVINNPITLNGNNTLGGFSDAAFSNFDNRSVVQGAGNNVTGFDVGYSMTNSGTIDLTGVNSTAVRLHGGSLYNSGVIKVASGIGIEASEGENTYFPESAQLAASDGIAAVRVNNNASFRVLGDGIFRNSIEGDGSADAILLDKGATGLAIDGTTLTSMGSGSAINNLAETSNIAMTNTYIYARGSGSGIRSATSFNPQGSVTIEPSGSATGYTFANADGSTTRNDMVIPRGIAILVGSGGTGVRANTSGQVISEGNIYVTTESGGSAIVTSTASEVINRGDIYSWSTVAPVIDLRGGSTLFINEGTLGTQYPETPLVVGGATNDRIALIDGAVNGDVDTGNGTDTLVLTGGTINGSLTMGSGVNNQAYVQNVSLKDVSHITTAGGEGSTLSLSDIAASGGSFTRDDLSRGVNLGAGWSTINFLDTDWTLTDSLKLAHSSINIDGGSTLFAGNGVNPVLAGATGDSLVVNNAGTLDLTNGSGLPGDTLTINGTLNSLYGRLRLNSVLNGGGALSNQSSDTLRVTGDANGTALIEVTPAATSTGLLSDINHNAVIEANEGISLAQVAGNASADSFALQGGYLAAGPWRYALYSFAPGSSEADQRLVAGSGNQFWDYRLANDFVTRGASSRAAVVPQVPAYVSEPVGLMYYTAAVLGDLQQRLGELRHQQDLPAGDGGDMFVRYTGSNLRYKTSQSFNDFGYNFDLDYSALQVGGNLLRLDGDKDSLRGGIAYTRGNTRLRPDAADGYSSTTFNSDSLALYSSWLRDSGLYLDGTLAYHWHRGETDIGRKQDVAKIKGKGWSASLQSGYPFALGNGVRLEPQVQLIYMHLAMDSFTDKENLAVSYNDYNQTAGRIGAKLDRSWSDDGGRQYTPYLRANYFKGWGGNAKTTVGAKDIDGLDHTFTSGKFGQMWEAGIGGTATFRNDVSLYAEADYRKEIDSNGAKGWDYNVGVRWTF